MIPECDCENCKHKDAKADVEPCLFYSAFDCWERIDELVADGVPAK